MVKVYDILTDSMVEVTQKWCDDMHAACSMMAKQRAISKWVLGLHPIRDKMQIEAMEQCAGTLGVPHLDKLAAYQT